MTTLILPSVALFETRSLCRDIDKASLPPTKGAEAVQQAWEQSMRVTWARGRQRFQNLTWAQAQTL